MVMATLAPCLCHVAFLLRPNMPHDGIFDRNIAFYRVSAGLGLWLKSNVGTFDVVHAHALFSFAPTAAAFLARRAGVPYILRPLGVLAPCGMTGHHPFLKRYPSLSLNAD
jgi:hypothetical protein